MTYVNVLRLRALTMYDHVSNTAIKGAVRFFMSDLNISHAHQLDFQSIY